jgi:ParB-like chromosome segregation protein Spo0J
LTRRVELLNRLRRLLHEHIPFRNEPTDCVEWLPAEGVEGNNYNPNAVAPPEMRLLEHSVRVDGFTQPIVAHREGDRHVVVDGFHRQRVGKDVLDIAQRLHGYLPVVTVRSHRADVSDRMAATIRHNRARGVHGVRPMTDIVTDLLTQGWSEADVARELGMDPDEVLRFKQISGLPGLFADHSYSQSWE